MSILFGDMCIYLYTYRQIHYKTKELGINEGCDAFLENETYVNKNAQSSGTYADALERGMVLYAR